MFFESGTDSESLIEFQRRVEELEPVPEDAVRLNSSTHTVTIDPDIPGERMMLSFKQWLKDRDSQGS